MLQGDEGKRGAVRRRGGGNDGGDGGGEGIMRFYTDDAPGFQISPTTVLTCSLAFIGLVVIMHIIGKFRQ